MSVFLDTSVLLKLYFSEPDSTEYLTRVNSTGGAIIISTLSRVEFASAANKKVRTGAVEAPAAVQGLQLFMRDAADFQFVPISESLLTAAAQLVSRHAPAGLRTLDAIQLACALSVRSEASLFLTADQRLAAIFELEGLAVR